MAACQAEGACDSTPSQQLLISFINGRSLMQNDRRREQLSPSPLKYKLSGFRLCCSATCTGGPPGERAGGRSQEPPHSTARAINGLTKRPDSPPVGSPGKPSAFNYQGEQPRREDGEVLGGPRAGGEDAMGTEGPLSPTPATGLCVEPALLEDSVGLLC